MIEYLTNLTFGNIGGLWLVLLLFLLAMIPLSIALKQRTRGAIIRALAILLLFLAVLDPRLISPIKQSTPEQTLIMLDKSVSMAAGERSEKAEEIAQNLYQKLEEKKLNPQIVKWGENSGSELFPTLNNELQKLPNGKASAAIIVSDGRISDKNINHNQIKTPLYLVLAGDEKEFNLHIEIKNAPQYTLVKNNALISFSLEKEGKLPSGFSHEVPYKVEVDGEKIIEGFTKIGKAEQIEVPIKHAGKTFIVISVPDFDGEITTKDNQKPLAINGVRERLKVLLASGRPHPVGRTLRNILKSDPAVDLVHFIILRTYKNFDSANSSELSLIPFPVDELFLEKVDKFDLIIFDRFDSFDIILPHHLFSIAEKVKKGGAFLMIAGEEFATKQDLVDSSIGDILPINPSGKILKKTFIPELTEEGKTHPITEPMLSISNNLGNWQQAIETTLKSGKSLLEADGNPLLVISNAEEGRVAALLSDNLWLWERGIDGEGPYLPLFRRTVHWLMREPTLDENYLELMKEKEKLYNAMELFNDEKEPQNLTVSNEKLKNIVHASGGKISYANDALPEIKPAQNLVITGTIQRKLLSEVWFILLAIGLFIICWLRESEKL